MEKEDKLSLLKEILNNRYTENNVDIVKNTIEGYTIIIYYPEVVIYKDTNSDKPIYNRKKVYALAHISDNYLLTSVKFTSSSYTESELYNKFILPHVTAAFHLGENNDFLLANPCLGRTTYFRAYNLTLELDILNFLEDLERFMSTESPSGVPFKYCNKIATYNPNLNSYQSTLVSNTTLYIYSTTSIILEDKVIDIILDFIDKKLEDILEIFKFSYMNGELIPNNIYKYAIYKLSKVFEDYIKSLDGDRQDIIDYLINKRVLLKTAEIEDRIYTNSGYNAETNYDRTLRDFKNRYVCIFKGKKIYPTLIVNKKENTNKYTIIVNPQLAQILINKIKSKGLILQNKENESNYNREITD